MPAVPWLGMNFAFPLYQDILLRPWLDEEVAVLERTRYWKEAPGLAGHLLAKMGFRRSLQAVSEQRKALRMFYAWDL